MITAKIAQTLDGKIATETADSKWITSIKTRNFARRKRAKFDAILVGINTVLVDNPHLTPANAKKGFKRIVVDSKLRLPLDAKVIKSGAKKDLLVVTTRKAPQIRIKRLEKLGVEVMLARATRTGQVDLKQLTGELKKKSIKKILIEGGATIIGSALRAGIVNQLHIYIAPKLIGDQAALDSVVGLNIKTLTKSINLKIKKIQTIDKDLLIKADVYRNR